MYAYVYVCVYLCIDVCMYVCIEFKHVVDSNPNAGRSIKTINNE